MGSLYSRMQHWKSFENKLSPEFVKKAQEDFKIASNSNDLNGSITKAQFEVFFRNTPTQQVAGSLFRAFDKDNNRKICWKEWACIQLVACSGNVEDKIALAFQIFDEDGSGDLDHDEMVKMYQTLYKAKTLPKWRKSFDEHPEFLQSIEEVFERYDTNKDGKLQFSEFAKFYRDTPMLEIMLKILTGI